MKNEHKQHLEQIKIQAEACKKLRAWITGYEAGSDNRVLNADNLRLLILAVDRFVASEPKPRKAKETS